MDLSKLVFYRSYPIDIPLENVISPEIQKQIDNLKDDLSKALEIPKEHLG